MTCVPFSPLATRDEKPSGKKKCGKQVAWLGQLCTAVAQWRKKECLEHANKEVMTKGEGDPISTPHFPLAHLRRPAKPSVGGRLGFGIN